MRDGPDLGGIEDRLLAPDQPALQDSDPGVCSNVAEAGMVRQTVGKVKDLLTGGEESSGEESSSR